MAYEFLIYRYHSHMIFYLIGNNGVLIGKIVKLNEPVIVPFDTWRTQILIPHYDVIYQYV